VVDLALLAGVEQVNEYVGPALSVALQPPSPGNRAFTENDHSPKRFRLPVLLHRCLVDL